MRLAISAAAALLASAAAAWAGDVPLTLGYDTAVSGEFTYPTATARYTLTVTATTGDTLVYVASEADPVPAILYGPDGRPVATLPGEATNDGDAQGVELPRVVGTYVLEVGPDLISSVALYRVGWQPDCRGDVLTRCTIAPGKTKSAAIGFDADSDAYAVKAKGGRSYVARLRGIGPAGMGVVDAKGRPVKVVKVGSSRFDLRFFLPTRGALPYRIVVAGKGMRSLGGPYTLRLVAGGP